MKKLNKLQINKEKLMKNEELVTLRGGDGSCCVCLNGSGTVMGYMAGYDQSSCDANCDPLGWDGSYGPWTYC
jgi:hypothetical protein